MADVVRVISAFQRRSEQLQAAITLISDRLRVQPNAYLPDGTDVTDQWLDDEVAKLVRLHSEKTMTEDCSNMWINGRV